MDGTGRIDVSYFASDIAILRNHAILMEERCEEFFYRTFSLNDNLFGRDGNDMDNHDKNLGVKIGS